MSVYFLYILVCGLGLIPFLLGSLFSVHPLGEHPSILGILARLAQKP